MKKRCAAVILLGLAAVYGFAENDNLKVKSSVDWVNGRLRMEIAVPLDLAARRFPEARQAAEQQVEDVRSGLLLDAFSPVTLRSDATVAEILGDPEAGAERRRALAALKDLSLGGVRTGSLVAEDFKSLTIVYQYPFYGDGGLIAPFIHHTEAMPLPASPGYYASRPFTGLVIYAKGTYASFGKDAPSSLTPALLPRIFYLSDRRTIEPVLDSSMVDPQALEKQGLLAYVRSTDPSAYAERVGLNPLTVSAFAVYGTHDTDIVISEDAARMLLANDANRNLLRQGNIVVIID